MRPEREKLIMKFKHHLALLPLHVVFFVFAVATLSLTGSCKTGFSNENPNKPRKESASAPSSESAGADADFTDITVFHTSDEHGWLQPTVPPGDDKIRGGAANFLSWIVEKEGFAPGSFLLLSSGDNWTGPAVSTWFEGRPMVEVFNLMGYDGVAIGNHEFDFGRAVMIQRFDESIAPFLGANIVEAGTGRPAFFAAPYVIRRFKSVNVGIIGLANIDTRTGSHPLFSMDLDFKGYAETLNRYVPELRNNGADVVVVLAHECRKPLAEALLKINVKVDAVFGAHCHDLSAGRVAGVPLIESGWGMRSYSKLTLRYDHLTHSVVDAITELVKVEYPKDGKNPVTPDPDVSEVVQSWREKTGHFTREVVGYTKTGIVKASWAMANWVTDAWLRAFPEADGVIAVFGGMRQSIGTGPIKMGDIFGMLPFENSLVIVTLSGAELYKVLSFATTSCELRKRCYPALGGMSFNISPQEPEIKFSNGREFSMHEEYTIVVSDFMYFGGSNYPIRQGPDADLTGVNWRDPVVEWTRNINSNKNEPLESFLDPTPRIQPEP